MMEVRGRLGARGHVFMTTGHPLLYAIPAIPWFKSKYTFWRLCCARQAKGYLISGILREQDGTWSESFWIMIFDIQKITITWRDFFELLIVL